MISLGVWLILSYHEVNNSITEEDKLFIAKYLEDITSLEEHSTYKEELEFIRKVQNSVLTIAPLHKGLPYDTEREAKDLFLATEGLCYDRSRVIEKILRFSGFETRHISIYPTKKTGSSIISLITPKISSHAVTEVLTKKGWVVVDSNDPWLAIDTQGNPVSLAQINSKTNDSPVVSLRHEVPSQIYQEPFIFIYGLYSKHGRFYPPYNFIPDVNYGELVQNFI